MTREEYVGEMEEIQDSINWLRQQEYELDEELKETREFLADAEYEMSTLCKSMREEFAP